MIGDGEVLEHLTLLSVNSASGLALGMSVVVLGDVLGWRWAERRPWLVAAVLVGIWLPFALSGVVEVRRIGNTIVSLYMCWLFLAYDRRVRSLANAAAGRVRPAPTAAEVSCSVRLAGGCVPSPRRPMDDA